MYKMYFEKIKSIKHIKYIAIGFVLLVVFFAFLFKKEPVKIDDKVNVFAEEIIKEYQSKNDYSGLYKKNGNLIAGDANGQMLGFGSKSFMIVAKSIDKDECVSYIVGSQKQNLSLLSININDSDYVWGAGLPIGENKLVDICKSNNKIVWNYK